MSILEKDGIAEFAKRVFYRTQHKTIDRAPLTEHMTFLSGLNHFRPDDLQLHDIVAVDVCYKKVSGSLSCIFKATRSAKTPQNDEQGNEQPSQVAQLGIQSELSLLTNSLRYVDITSVTANERCSVRKAGTRKISNYGCRIFVSSNDIRYQ